MVIERLLETKFNNNVPTYSLVLGVFYTLVAFTTSFLLFKPFIGLATILFTVILALPAVIKLFDEQAVKEKMSNEGFYKKHRTIIDFYTYFFIGCFVVFFVIAMIAPGKVFSLEDLKGVRAGKASEVTLQNRGQSSTMLVMGVFQNNMYVMIIAFFLSLFYGSGSLFLLTFNGAIWASALVRAVKLRIPELTSFWYTYSYIGCNLGIIFIHLIPEVGAYFLGAVAGGVLSNALLHEKFRSETFKNTMKDVAMLVLAASIILYAAALVEMTLSKSLFQTNICVNPTNWLNITYLILIAAIIIGESVRRKVTQ